MQPAGGYQKAVTAENGSNCEESVSLPVELKFVRKLDFSLFQCCLQFLMYRTMN